MAQFITLTRADGKKSVINVEFIRRMLERDQPQQTAIYYNQDDTVFEVVSHSIEEIMNKITGFDFSHWQ